MGRASSSLSTTPTNQQPNLSSTMGNYAGCEEHDTKMGKRDGIYRMEQCHNMDLIMKKIGIPDADIKLMTSPRNICTLSLMRNKDGSFSLVHHSTLAPHLKMDITTKVGEIKKVEKPFPFTVLWEKKTDIESHVRIEMNKNVILCIVRWNNHGFTVTTELEGSDLSMGLCSSRVTIASPASTRWRARR